MINSDLDDSDDELKEDDEDNNETNLDIVFCVYDKVSVPQVLGAGALLRSHPGAASQE